MAWGSMAFPGPPRTALAALVARLLLLQQPQLRLERRGGAAHPPLHLKDAPRTSLAILGTSMGGDVKEFRILVVLLRLIGYA